MTITNSRTDTGTVTDRCRRAREEIAWGRGLGGDTRAHLDGCRECAASAAEFARLEERMDTGRERENDVVDVPPGFADRVMAAVERSNASSSSRVVSRNQDRFGWLIERFVERFVAAFRVRAFQIALQVAGVALALAFPLSGAH